MAARLALSPDAGPLNLSAITCHGSPFCSHDRATPRSQALTHPARCARLEAALNASLPRGMQYVGTLMSSELLIEAFDRISSVVHSALTGASIEVLTFRADPGANTMAWLIWHLTRVQDGHIAELVGEEQVWTAGGWADRFDLPFDPGATGYGQSAGEVAAVRADAELLAGYYDAVHVRTLGYLHTLAQSDFARIVDTAWDPPVTLAVRLVSILSDDLQHAGQASYVRGLAMRAGL